MGLTTGLLRVEHQLYSEGCSEGDTHSIDMVGTQTGQYAAGPGDIIKHYSIIDTRNTYSMQLRTSVRAIQTVVIYRSLKAQGREHPELSNQRTRGSNDLSQRILQAE